MEYSADRSKVRYVNEFKELLKKADAEHQKTRVSRKTINVDIPQNVMDNIIDNVNDSIESVIEDRMEDFTTNTEITNNALRELRGILNVKGNSGEEKIQFLKVESDYWKKKAEQEQNNEKAKLYEAISKTADLKADEIRLRLNRQPVGDEAINMVQEEAENNDLTRFEKFKKWARENMTGLAAVTIAVAGILTTVLMAGRKALRKGAQSLSKFGKAVANIAKKLGPVIAALGIQIFW